MLYSLVHINETSPYEVFAYKEDTVYFITDDGSEYLVGFIEETNIGIQRAYQLFIIKKRNGIHIGTDVKIGQNGENVLEYHLWTPKWTEMLQASKFSKEKWPLAFELLNNCGGEKREGFIGLQDHGDDVWFRNIRVKVLD